MIELTFARVEMDKTALCIIGNLENGEIVSIAIPLNKLKGADIDTDRQRTYITLYWEEKKEDDE